jgi:hypothetical protein
MAGEPQQAGTVPVRVQVIDLNPRIVDLVVPTFLAADDLTQRVARDVGLGGWWEDGTRRQFLLRARGRVLGGHERLQDVGIVPYELLHLLPEPRQGAPVQERPLGVTLPLSVPPSRATIVWRTIALVVWVGLFSLSASTAPTLASSWAGGFGLGFLAVNAAHGWTHGRRGLWPGPIALIVAVVAIAAPLALGIASVPFPFDRLGIGLMTLIGLAMGWLGGLLVWLGPIVEPDIAARRQVAGGAQQPSQVLCGVCGMPALPDVQELCRHGCGLVFHRGCVRAREAVAAPGACAVCGKAA